MSGLSTRDLVFLDEMGLGPLWRLRAAEHAATAADGGDVALAEAPQLVPEQVPEQIPEPTPQRAPAAGVPAPVPRPAAPAVQAGPEPASPRPPGPSPLQRVAQSASALAPVAPPAADAESAWDDAALPSDASPDEIARMDWDQLAVAIASCRRCSACRDGRVPVPGSGARTARWVVAAGASTAADDKARVPLAGDPGKLLDNMLLAVGMGRERDVYVTNLIKCRPSTPNGGERAPTAEEAAACRPYLEREVALAGAGTVVTLGQIAANTLLGRPLQEPLAGARGAVHALAVGDRQVDLVATLHPGELLRRGADKAQAWADLCRARGAGARSGD
ncbi:uracil-DNA glycosylase family protein [uncultured Massilia sp.]|uniref:uracil-DNA glycosylase n=1 Tax=uncultured Massilia sp. TaxID=169973 RepID=UPI0025D99873|nr:uracil-DNA glycosylase [uncultured Massilia sp.]